jgi:uncharacterized protein (DUF1684 family)
MRSICSLIFVIFVAMKSIAFLCVFLVAFAVKAQSPADAAPQKFDRLSAESFQKELNAEFASKDKSPLEAADRATFKGLDFFPVSDKYFVVAEFVRTENEKPFPMKTSTERRPMYEKYGEISFTLDGKPLKLNVYRSIDLSQKEEYKDELFLPFSDLTSGNESYLGGRYIDLKIPDGNTLAIDFNKAYNPYCAYNHRYSCPAVPQENDLTVAIRAGVKKFHD